MPLEISSAETTGAVVIQDADTELQNWTFVADGSRHALFPPGVASGVGDTYATSRAGCPMDLRYQPLTVPLPALAPGTYAVCHRSGPAPPRFMGVVTVRGPVTFRTYPADVTANAPFRIVFYGVQLAAGDAWGPAAAGVCNGTQQTVRPTSNRSVYQSAVEATHEGLARGQYSVCYYAGQVVVLNGSLAVQQPKLVGIAGIIGMLLPPACVCTRMCRGAHRALCEK